MRIGHFCRLSALILTLPVLALAAPPRPCVPSVQAEKIFNKDICISAHIYDVVQLQDGITFLDVCPPQTPDDQCRFFLISLPNDRRDVGDLKRFLGADVQIRGVVQPMHGRAGMFLSHSRQFNGGPPKFKPNPLLARGFDAESSRPPLSDPNLRRQGGRRAFMNTRDQEPLPAR